MGRMILGEAVLVIALVVGTYVSLRWIFRKADKEADAAIKADADGTIKASHEKMEKAHE